MKGKEEQGGRMEALKEAENWNIKGYWWRGVTFIEQGASIRNKSCLCSERNEREIKKCIDQQKKAAEEKNNQARKRCCE